MQHFFYKPISVIKYIHLDAVIYSIKIISFEFFRRGFGVLGFWGFGGSLIALALRWKAGKNILLALNLYLVIHEY